ncbi:MAG: 50S ribosomal protein L10 [Planctomycetes bacterium GWF2_42_9]|nr:MAG: 50S ribosomal protein L10 [Planctomycetes bacterium GWF2_42_9]HAL45028.1 50S ribosomal protein L10 [Phycisphaerales bacterium]
MSKQVKQLLTNELESKFNGINEFIVVDITGIDGIANNKLREKFVDKKIKLTMVRNAMMRQAMKSLNMPVAMDLFLTGSSTVAVGGASIVDLAKEIDAISKEIPVKFKGAYLEGTALDAVAAKNLINMKTRAELQGEVIMLAKSPASRLASQIGAPASKIAGCIKTIIEKGEKEAPAPAAA